MTAARRPRKLNRVANLWPHRRRSRLMWSLARSKMKSISCHQAIIIVILVILPYCTSQLHQQAPNINVISSNITKSEQSQVSTSRPHLSPSSRRSSYGRQLNEPAAPLSLIGGLNRRLHWNQPLVTAAELHDHSMSGPSGARDLEAPDPMEPCYLANNRASESLTISESTPVGTVVGEIMVSLIRLSINYREV